MMKVFFATTVLLLTCGLMGVAPAPNNDMKGLIVYGDGFAFSAVEPDGWQGDTQDAESFQTNLVFFRANEDADHYSTIISVTVMPKDGDVPGDLAADMQHYSAHFKGMTFADLTVAHPTYASYSKIYRMPDLVNYVTYLDPGASVPWYFIVTMQPKTGTTITPGEVSVFDHLVATITYMGAPKSTKS